MRRYYLKDQLPSTDTPPGSRADSPDREEEDDREVKDYTTVLEMVKAVRDRLTALVLDNTNIRAACDELRRQCHSQGVAFGDLSRLVESDAGGPGGNQSVCP